MNKKYKLLQDINSHYGFCPKGTTAALNGGVYKFPYSNNHGGYCVGQVIVHNNTEFFEEVIEPTYTDKIEIAYLHETYKPPITDHPNEAYSEYKFTASKPIPEYKLGSLRTVIEGFANGGYHINPDGSWHLVYQSPKFTVTRAGPTSHLCDKPLFSINEIQTIIRTVAGSAKGHDTKSYLNDMFYDKFKGKTKQ